MVISDRKCNEENEVAVHGEMHIPLTAADSVLAPAGKKGRIE